MPSDTYYRRKEAAAFLKAKFGLEVAPDTLKAWFIRRSDGPPVRYWGRWPVYREDELIEWATRRVSLPRTSSSQPLGLQQEVVDEL